MKNERSFATNVYEITPQVSSDSFEVDPSVVYGPITMEDAAWMSELGADTSAWSEEALGKLNITLEVGSHDLRYDTNPAKIASVMAARREFYEEILGWGDEGHFLHNAYQYIDSTYDTLILTSTAVSTARYIANCGINVAEVVKTTPEALALKPDSVKAKMENFIELGLDAVKVVNALPAIIGLNPDSVKAKIENLTELGLDAVKVVNAFPIAIGLSPDNIRLKARALQHASSQELLTGADVSAIDIKNIFTLPTESLLTFLASKDKRDIPNSGTRLATIARRYMTKELGVTISSERHEYISDNWDKYAKELGHVALEWAGYKKLLVKPEGRRELELNDVGQ